MPAIYSHEMGDGSAFTGDTSRCQDGPRDGVRQACLRPEREKEREGERDREREREGGPVACQPWRMPDLVLTPAARRKP